MQITNLPIQPPDTCNVVSVVDVNSGQCWVLVYRPEEMSHDITQLCKYLDYLLAEYRSVTIMGDFNLGKMKWHVLIEQQQLSPIYRKFYQFCASCDLSQIVPGPMHRPNELDIILTTHDEQFGDIIIDPPLLNSDHDIVVCQFYYPSRGTNPAQVGKVFSPR